jgi:hypothetical protein
VENDSGVDVTVASRSIRRYMANLDAHTLELQSICRRAGIAFLRFPSNAPLTTDLLPALLASGVVQ